MQPEFLLTSFIIVATPGIGVLFTLSAALSHGGRAGILAAFASTIGIVPHLIAAMLGIAAIIHASALLFDTLRYLGVAYLFWMAWRMLRDKSSLSVETAAERKSVARVLTDGILLNLLNPKLSIFFVAFLPQFIAADDPAPFTRMLLLSGVFMAMTFAVFALYGLLAGGMRRHVIERPAIVQWLRRSFGAAFALLGVKLAMSER